MKKIIYLFTVFIMFCSQVGAVPVYGVFVKDKDTNKSKIKTFFAQKKEQRKIEGQKREDIREIKKVISLLTKYSNEHDSQKLATLYDKKYRSFDGFNYDTLIKMLDETFDSYENISYKSDLQSINLYGDKAVVNLVDTTEAVIASKNMKMSLEKIPADIDLRTGYLEGVCNYAIYLQKINDEWKIIGDNIISEVTSVKYGAARKYPMEFIAPLDVAKDSEYCLTLKMPVKRGVSIAASLGKERILYPSAEPKDVFRKVPKDGILERVVRSNKDGFNEYAIASVGITNTTISPDFRSLTISMSGLAFLMQRVNLYNDINPVSEVKEDKKQDSKNEG